MMSWLRRYTTAILLLVLSTSYSFARQTGLQASGVVEDLTGLPLNAAAVELYSLHGMHLARTITGQDGRFLFSNLAEGSYVIEIRVAGFLPRHVGVNLHEGQSADIWRITLSPRGLHTEISVTASPGSVSELPQTPALVSVTNDAEITQRSHPTLASALSGHPGHHLQVSTAGQASSFLRGLTGFHVLTLVDGVRFNNSTFRFGPNQYVALIDPSQARRIEMTLGAAASEYGSDALGGAIHIQTPVARFSDSHRWRANGRIAGFADSADLSAGSATRFSFGNDRLAVLAGGSWRHHNDLRTGGGEDSHHALRRLLGLQGPQIRSLLGSRQRETAFSQFGRNARVSLRLNNDQQITAWYQHGTQRGVRGSKDLWGGLGRLQSAFSPQSVNLFYLRHEKQKLGALDTFVSTFSINSQLDGSVTQGLRYVDPVRRDRARTDAYGYTVQSSMRRGRRHTAVFGAELYTERVQSQRLVFAGGAGYQTLALYGQTSMESPAQRLRASLGGRFTSVWFRGREFHDATYNSSLTLRLTEGLRVYLVASRGFRAPNLNDLATLGLQDLGFEFPAEAIVQSGGLIGSTSGESALSTGRPVKPLGSERLFNYEAGVSWQGKATYARAQLFDAELYDAIARRTILFRDTNMPQQITGLAVHRVTPTRGQAAQGIAGVATEFDPRNIKAFVNVGRQRYAGLEAVFTQKLAASIELSCAYSFLLGRELDPGGPIRRLPPQQGTLDWRFSPGRRWWTQLSIEAAGPQRRLSGGDLSDERIGAERSRLDIAAFFNGDRLRTYVVDGVFLPTMESLEAIQERVLPRSIAPGDNDRIPLYHKTAGFAAIHLTAGFQTSETTILTIRAGNLTDRNYRNHGSGIDAPGRHVRVGWQVQF